jgi:tRNA (cytidine/uridine-2'-O-)-methyltransferase
MDYLELLDWHVHVNWQATLDALSGRRLWFLTSAGRHDLYKVDFESSDALIFGSEVEGLPHEIRETMGDRDIKIPMAEPRARCLNLATSVAITVYEQLRQTGGLHPEVDSASEGGR